MKNMKKISAFILAVVVVVIAAFVFLRHERRQSSEIIQLHKDVQLLMAKTEFLLEKTKSNSDAETFRRNCVKCATGGG